MQSAFHVLVVDDNPADLHLMREALCASSVRIEVLTAESGEQALALLNRSDVPKPNLVMLDVDMPRLSGHAVLSTIKRSEHLRATVVLMYSSSDSERDIEQAYYNGANGYVLKAMDLESCFSLARTVVHFWSRIALLPNNVARHVASA